MPAIVPKSLKQCREAHDALITVLVEEWWACALKVSNGGGWGGPYLVGRKGRDSHNCGIWVSLRVVNEPADDEFYLRPEPLPLNATRERVDSIIREWLAHEPCYTYAD